MQRIILGATVLAVLVGCGSDAESREDLESRTPTREAPAPSDRPVQAGPDRDALPTVPARAIPAGSLLTFEVRETLSTSTHDVGDVFSLVLVDAVRGDGDAFLASGTPARGLVTEVHRSSGPDDASLLVVQVASVEAGGSQVPMEGEVQSTAIENSTRASGARTVATIATGSAAGAIIGQVLGRDTRATVTGAAVGTAVGIVVALSTRGGDSTLGEGTRIVVRLDRDLVY
jgi:hypothetical protein